MDERTLMGMPAEIFLNITNNLSSEDHLHLIMCCKKKFFDHIDEVLKNHVRREARGEGKHVLEWALTSGYRSWKRQENRLEAPSHKLVYRLIERAIYFGANVNEVFYLTEGEFTEARPLHLAAAQERLIDSVRLLIEKGADVNLRAIRLEGFFLDGDLPVLKRDLAARFRPLRKTGRHGRIFNEVDFMPLALPFVLGHTQIVKLLIEKGASLELAR